MSNSKEGCLINFKDLVDKDSNEMINASHMDNTDTIKTRLLSYLEKYESIEIDMTDVRSVSPSFAYESFGQLYETPEKLEKLKSRLKFLNDKLNLQSSIWKAIDRRQKVLLSM